MLLPGFGSYGRCWLSAGNASPQHDMANRGTDALLSESDAVRLLSDIFNTIASGEELLRQEVNGNIRVGVTRNDIVVWLAKQPANNAWVVTGYEKNPDGANAGRATSTPTSTTASLTRDGRVAGFGEIVAQEPGSDNPDFASAALR